MNNSTYFHLLFICVSVVYNDNIVAFIYNSKNCLFCIMKTFWIQKRIKYFFFPMCYYYYFLAIKTNEMDSTLSYIT